MRIDCPYCGGRDVSEFVYGGDATKVRPETVELEGGDVREVSDGLRKLFYDYVYVRDNPRGDHEEHWYHAGGCRSWLRVCRNTATHEVKWVKSEAGE
jgi:sarcosine oxidase subunit delta